MRKFEFLFIFLNSVYNGFSQKTPNIVLFFVDDPGWADLGYRNQKFLTPKH